MSRNFLVSVLICTACGTEKAPANSPPIISSVIISPEAVTASSIVTCAAQATDLDGDTVSIAYEWTGQNGESLSVESELILTPESFRPEQLIRCTATASDGIEVVSETTEVTIINRLPSIDEITLTPNDTITVSSILRCAAEVSDEDNDPDLTVQYSWHVNNTEIANGDSLPLNADDFGDGDIVACVVTVSDAFDAATTGSVEVVVGNTAPLIGDAIISPPSPNSTDNLQCHPNSQFDEDGDEISLSTQWFVNGNLQQETTNTLAGPFFVGDSISCSLTPSDGKVDGESRIANTIITNSTPVVEEVVVSPLTLRTDDMLTASAVFSDVDAEQDVAVTYEWHVYYANTGNVDLVVQNNNGNTLDGTVYFDKDDSVYVVVTANDGIENGNSLASIPIIIGNSAPTDLVVEIASDDGFVNDATLTCSGLANDIDDGDVLHYDYTWSTGDTGNTVLLDRSMLPGTEISCTAIVSDGTDTITETTNVVLENRLPVVDSVTLSPTVPSTLTTEVHCLAEASDEDGETVALLYEWSIDGVIQGETSANLSMEFLYQQDIQCTVTPVDGMAAGIPMTMTVSVGNSPPSVTSVSLDATDVYTNDTIAATTVLSDVDIAHNPVAIYEWHVVDASDANTDRIVSVTGNSLSGADPEQHFGRDDQVYVVVTPNDGVEDGEPVTSPAITIKNSPPTNPTLLLEASSDPAVAFVDDLLCTVDTLSMDDDPEDNVVYSFDWVRNNGDIAQSENFTSATIDTLNSTLVSGGEWTCEVTASDGSEDSDTVTAVIPVEFNTDVARRTELLECVVEPGGCDVILSAIDNPSSAFHNYIMPSPGSPIGTAYAGQTLCIPSGNYSGVYLYGLQGTANAPVVVTNCGEGQVVIDGNASGAFDVDDGQYLKFTGTGDPDQLYGFVVQNAGTGRASVRVKGDDVGVTDIEIEFFEIMGPAYTGITVSNYPYCNPDLDRSVFTQANTLIHHNYIHDIRNDVGENGGEGIYIGTSHYFMSESPTSSGCTTGYQDASLRGVQVYENIIEDTGRDGIQVGAAVEDMAIYHNTIRRYALAEDFGHVGGIQVNPGSVGHIYANFIESDANTTSETAIQFAGGEDGPSYIYNNVITGASISLAFLTRMGNESSPVYVHNNTFINRYESPTEGVSSTGTYTLYLGCGFDGSSTTQDFYITNNIFTNYGSVGSYIYGVVGSHYSKYFSDDGCLINGMAYGNNLDENLKLPGNLYLQDPNEVGFVDYASGDYHLDSGSPAMDAGEDLSHLFTDDFDGANRENNGNFDMGAFEFE